MTVVSAGQVMDSALAEEKSDIMKCAEEAQKQASAEQLRMLRLMVNDPAFSDVVFLCHDRKRVQASRMLLAGTSEVLKSMLTNGMAESSLAEIEMPEISSPVMLAVIEFLYTATLFDHQPKSWRMACEVLIASKFFILPNLEMITRKFMHSLTSAVVEDLPRAASMLTEAVALKTLCDNTDVNLRRLATILSSSLSDAMYVKNLSEDAFDYLLKNSEGFYDGQLSLKEYLRFRQVTRWWIYQSDFGSHAAEELLTFVAPDEKGALSLCRSPNNLEIVEPPGGYTRLANDWFSWQMDEVSRKSAVRLMSNLVFKLIPPALLLKVVEPLKVVSKDEIRRLFRYHALRRPMLLDTVECCWEHGKSYATLHEGYVIQKTQDTVGLAVMTASMSHSYGIHQWHIMLEECSEAFAEMGFKYYSCEKPELDGVTLSDLSVARVLKFHEDQVSASMEATDGSIDWKVLLNGLSTWKVPVVFNYNAWKHTCSLSIDGKDLGIVWEHLPSELYYPAVSLGTTSRGRVRFELLSGFDIL